MFMWQMWQQEKLMTHAENDVKHVREAPSRKHSHHVVNKSKRKVFMKLLKTFTSVACDECDKCDFERKMWHMKFPFDDDI